MENKKGGSFVPLIIVMLVSLLIAGLWTKIPVIKETIGAGLDPTLGAMLNWNILVGMLVIVFILSVIMTLAQKYLTDQATLKELKKEQKLLQDEMKKYKEHPEKMLELQKKQFEIIPKTMKLTMRPLIYTGIPIILFFRWFMDYFAIMPDFKFFGFLSWFWFYLIFSIIFSIILRKVFKVY